MNKILERPVSFFIILTLLCGYLFFFKSGSMALTDPDETFYAQTAKEMLSKNEWITPHLYGKPQFEKPIFFYWLVELSYKVFGVNEFAARFPSAILGLAGVIGIYFLGAVLFNRRVGALAAVMLGTCAEYIILSRACVTDMTLSTFMLFGALFFICGYMRGKSYFYLSSAASFAVATLAKGPVAVILPVASILLFLILARDLKSLKKMPVVPAVLVFLAVALPWYLVIYKYHGREFTDAFFGFHNITRFLSAEHKVGSQYYYNIPIILGGFFPWSVFLPYGFWHIFRRVQGTGYRVQGKGEIFVLSWFAVVFIFFSMSSTKLPTYIFPCFISLALTSAVFWDDFLTSRAENVNKAMVVSFYALAAVIFFGSIGVLGYIIHSYPSILSGVGVSVLFLMAGIAISLAAFFKKKFIAAFFLVVYALVIFLYPMSVLVIPEIGRYETSRVMADKLKTLMKEGEAMGSESNYRSGLAFYLDRFPVDLDIHSNFVDLMSSKNRIWAVVKAKNYGQLYDPKINRTFVPPSYEVYKLGKKVIVTNSLPGGIRYLIRKEMAK